MISKKRGLIFLVSMLALLFSASLVSAQTEGIPIQKDVFLGVPISGPEDFPEEITFTLYGAQNGLTPLGAQTFRRGQYTVDFEFSHSDGVTGGNVARVKADFTNTLNLKDDVGNAVKPKEIWAALEVAGTEVGARTKVSDETLVRLLLNSDASLATYLTLAYEGDENPITTIYKDLPISLTAADGSKKSVSDYFSAVVSGTAESRNLGVAGSSGQVQYNNGGAEGGAAYLYYDDVNHRVGIGTSAPTEMLHINGGRFAVTTNSAYAFYISNGTNYSLKCDPNNRRIAVGKWVSGATVDVEAGGTDDIMRLNNSTGRVLTVLNSGNVGIGTTNPGTYKLAVLGKIRATEIQVDTGWADFVFQPDYKLPSLNEVEFHIKTNGNLPGIPTEAEVKAKGINVGEISSKLLQKIEELTLYVIDLSKENESLKAQLTNLETELEKIKN